MDQGENFRMGTQLGLKKSASENADGAESGTNSDRVSESSHKSGCAGNLKIGAVSYCLFQCGASNHRSDELNNRLIVICFLFQYVDLW